MFILDEQICWSASDLTTASECEYAVARGLDYQLHRALPLENVDDPLQEHIARLGDRHEAALLTTMSTQHVITLDRVAAPYNLSSLEAARDATHKAFLAEPDTVYQAAFFDGEFFGYADFVQRADDGWLICDAKLARSAKPRALLQLAAYADQLHQLDLPTSAHVTLLLGNGERAEFRVADLLPVFRERRERLRALLRDHHATGSSVAWGDDRYLACGRCAECDSAAAAAYDLTGVAGLRMSQRRILRANGITTIRELAAATTVTGITTKTFNKLRQQAALQWAQMEAGPDAPMRYELTDTAHESLHALPPPSAGDLFFDFEGDPLYDEGNPAQAGLEYLWGVMDAAEGYVPFWAHTRAEERAAFTAFLDLVAATRDRHPDMHVYHYAPYETTALKRLAIRYQTREDELDDLLRAGVFVDLYATVRGAVRISRPSYSIKKLEPLYMGEQERDADGVTAGGDSILAYHQARDLRSDDPSVAQQLLDNLEAYNTYDCLSTLRLRDWLLARIPSLLAALPSAENAGDLASSAGDSVKGTASVDEHAEVFAALLNRAEPAEGQLRTPEQQVYAMLATALGYHRRENKSFWWEHFERLSLPLDDWSEGRDVFHVESVLIENDWAVPEGKARNSRRTLRLTGDWAPGSKPGSSAHVVFRVPGPAGVMGPEKAPFAAKQIEGIQLDRDDPRTVRLVESCKPSDTYADHPVALAPAAPPRTEPLAKAIATVATAAADSSELPHTSVLDLLARRIPRLRNDARLPNDGAAIANVIASLVAMDDSYLAIQGPPGTGKTWTGSRVIRELVEKHHWRVGVVAQSHAVVENMLAGVVKAGLGPDLVGKSNNDTAGPTWTDIKDDVKNRSAFLAEHIESGCVLGGTAWSFASDKLVEAAGLDLLVIDEAGQFSLANTLAVSVAAKRLLLLGDPQQLPQVSQGVHAEPVDDSALGWLMQGQAVVPATHGYFLAQSFRMHPALCAEVSTLSYEGQLSAAPAAAERDLVGVAPGLSVVRIPHHANSTASVEEADAIVAQVQAHLGAVWTNPEDSSTPRPLEPRDFIVVAPYNAQVATIRTALAAAGLSGVKVGTVDKFQGQEAPIALISMSASSHDDVPRGMGFLLNRNRTNVAISRAQWKAILVRSEALTAYMPTSVGGLLELSAFIGLCDAGRTV